MTLMGHLTELRSRLISSILVWALASCACYYFIPELLDVVREQFLRDRVELVFTKPTEAFIAYIKAAMVGGIFLASPVWLYHVIRFVAPGLESHEKKWVARLLPFSIVLFCLGATFAYYIVLPVTMNFFLSFTSDDLKAMLTIGEFLGFVTMILLLCGVAFQLPLVLYFAALLGLVTSKQLRENRRFAVFGAFLIAAVATPTPDAFTMTVVALPLWALFEISVVMIWLSRR